MAAIRPGLYCCMLFRGKKEKDLVGDQLKLPEM